MDVRNIEDVEPIVEHAGTVPVWWMVQSQEMRELTDGGFLELVNEFEVAGGGYVNPHRPCADPLLLLRHRRQGRGVDRLHEQLTGAPVDQPAVPPSSMSEASRPRSSTVVAPERSAVK